MSVVSTVVFLSQSLRTLANRMQSKAINAIEKRIKQVEKEQRQCEQHRSKQMIDCHNNFYKADARLSVDRDNAIKAIIAKFDAKQDKLAASFNENKRTISLTHQAASNDLKRELAMLGSELDHLTK